MSRVDIVIGPTASGKTSFAIQHANKHDGVIINADSMQVYDALPTLTARPDEREQAQADHRLYATLPPWDYCGAGRWRDMVIPEMDAVIAQGRRPILVGGSGFYLNALLKGFSPIPDIPIDVRLSLEELDQAERYARLQSVDPELAEKLHENDTQRITRALEVFTHTGTPLSEWQNRPLIPPPAAYQFHIIALLPERERVYEAINTRVDVMVENGVMAEVEALSDLMDEGKIADHMPIVKAHGFRAFRQVIKGQMEMAEAMDKTRKETRNYAKRQYTWARHQIAADEVIGT